MAYALATIHRWQRMGRLQAELMRQIDRWIGAPVCFLLTMFDRLRRVFSRGNGAAVGPKNILLIQLAEMGGWVVAQPAIRMLRRRYPQARIHLLTFDRSRELLALMGFAEGGEIVTIPTNSVGAFAGGSLRALRNLRGLKIDAAVNLEAFARFSTVLAYLSGAKTRVGFHPMANTGPYVGDLVTHKLLYNPHIHAGASFLALGEALAEAPGQQPHAKLDLHAADLSIDPLPPDPPEDQAMGQTLRQALGRDPAGYRLVILNTNASDLVPNRRWPMASFAWLAAELLKEPDIALVLTGAADEYAQNQALARSLGSDRVVNLAGRTSLAQLLALLRLGALIITNDSGPGHFAGLTATPALVLFGPETPRIFGPLGSGAETLYLGLACSPCVSAYNQKSSPCRDNRCLKQIDPRVVLSRTRAMLSGRADAR